MQSQAEFGEFLKTSKFTGKIGVVVKFPIQPGKVEDFTKLFGPVVEITRKEKGCNNVCNITFKI